METLHISDGAVRLSINNDETRVITFYPGDIGFANSYYELVANLTEKLNEFEQNTKNKSYKDQLDAANAVYKTLREGIDETFGEGTCNTVFGDHDSFQAYIQFINGVKPYIQDARKAKVDRYVNGNSGQVME